MSTLLYKIGNFASRRHWVVIGLWLAVIGMALGGGAALQQPTSSKVTVPGTAFQRVLDDLKSSLPAASGGVGTVTFEAKDGTLDAPKQAAIKAAIDRWQSIQGVRHVIEPFQTQAEIEATPEQLSAGRAKLEAGRAAAEKGAKQLDDAKATLDASRKKLDDSKAQIDSGKQQLALGEQMLTGLKAQLDAAKAAGDSATVARLTPQVTQLTEQITSGRAQLEAGEKQWTEGDTAWQAGMKAWEEGKAKSDAGFAELDASDAELDNGERRAELTQGLRFVTEDGKVAMTQIRFVEETQSLPESVRAEVVAVESDLEAAGVTTHFSNEIAHSFTGIVGTTELIGVGIAAIVLIVMLGTLIAAGLPLLMAGIGVAVATGVMWLLSNVWTMHDITPALATMIGLAVGIDYSLFIVNRHRNQLLAGMPLHVSVGRATGTAGTAVVFAGLTVIIALAALGVTGMPFLGLMGGMGALAVALAVIVAVTLTPALLGLIGRRLVSKRLWLRYGFTAQGEPIEGREHFKEDDEEAVKATRRGWSELVTSHPWATLVACLAVVGGLAIPAASLRLGLPDGGSEAKGSTSYLAYKTVEKSFGTGLNGPIVAVAKLPEGLSETEAAAKELDVAERLATVPGLERVLPIGLSEDRRTAAYQAVPTTGPAEAETVDLVNRVREKLPEIQAQTGASVDITGATVANIDMSDKLADALPPYLVIVVGMSLLILLLVFRSLVVPVLATLGFLLSLAGAFGGVVAVYQWGHLGSLTGVHNPGPVLSFLPTILIGVLFGLAMDYQMFMVSGMREAHTHGEDARLAVRTGFHHGARVVTAAAIIMASVFAGFMGSELAMVRPIGFGLALGVLLDAFVVRMTLTPAVMHLLGERAWWLPRWLDRVLPDLDVEGLRLARRLESGELT